MNIKTFFEQLNILTDSINELRRVIRSNDTISSEKRIMDQKELESFFNISKTTSKNWAKKGLLKPFNIGGKVFYNYQDVFDLIDKHEK